MKTIIKIRKFVSKQIFDIKAHGIPELFRKFYLLIRALLRIPIYIIAIVPCIIIRLISPWIIIRIEKVCSANYGNFALDLAMYCCKKKFKIDLPKKKHIDLLYIYHKDKIYNKQLAKMWKRKLNFFSSHLLDPINKVNKLIPGWKVHAIEVLFSKYERDIDNLIDKYQPLDFTIEEETYGKKMLNKFGLKDNDKFVCLAVRDNAYQLRKISSRFRDWTYHDYRNHDIDNFVLAAEELARRGYHVFRMGVDVNKPLNSSNPKIIDYANSSLRNDFMDVYLGAKCSFCISTHYGFEEVPLIFGRPIAFLGLPIGDLHTHNEKFLLITKHHIFKKEKRKLSFSEIFAHGVAYAFDTKVFEQKGIELVDYTPDDIKDFVIEMVENVEFKRKLNPEDEELQKTFKNLFASNLKRINYHKEIKNTYHKYHGQIRSRFSSKFLREHKDWLR